MIRVWSLQVLRTEEACGDVDAAPGASPPDTCVYVPVQIEIKKQRLYIYEKLVVYFLINK